MTVPRHRLVLAVGCTAALVAVAALGGSALGLAAPFSGSVYDTVGAGDERVASPYGSATVRYDGHGVPHVEAESEAALFYAVGYLQARDRLFQMDLQRRLVSGNLSAAVGERAVASDRFYRKLDFETAARASWRGLRDSEAAPAIEAYTAGVNRYVETGPLPPEFHVLGYEPTAWTPVDTVLVGKLVGWRLSGGFGDLRKSTVRARLGREALALYPDRLDHDSPVIRGASDAEPFDPGPVAERAAAAGDPTPEGKVTAASDSTTEGSAGDGDFGALYDWVAPHDAPPTVGSNNWAVSGEASETGGAVVANDPHLSLMAPPVWYEMHLTAPGFETRGVAFPGVPFVVIGRTTDVAWGVTNVGADVTDLYRYRTREGGYEYRGEFRAFESRTETIPVADGPDREVTVRKTVHGPVVEREGRRVAVAWTGLTATNETLAIYRLNRAEDVGDVREAIREFDVPAQNVVAGDRDGDTLYHPAGKYPIRVSDGRVVRGDRVFNGSAGHGEWPGFTPYGTSNWSGFVPFESLPHLDDPDVVASANQRVSDDPGFYMGDSFGDPYRGARIYEVLDEQAADGVGGADARALQRDVRSRAASAFVGYATGAIPRMSPAAGARARGLKNWDREMRADSTAALTFALWLAAFRNATFHDEFAAADLDASYYPRLSVMERLPRDSEWYDDATTERVETRADIAARAMNRTTDRIRRAGYEDYGDYNRLDVTHPFDRAWLNYPGTEMDGSPYTVFNFHRQGGQWGSSWRMVVAFGDRPPADDASGIIPGGQRGVFWSPHYHDQLDEWATGEYKPLTLQGPAGDPDIVFTEAGG